VTYKDEGVYLNKNPEKIYANVFYSLTALKNAKYRQDNYKTGV
jgi:hypothetical protein